MAVFKKDKQSTKQAAIYGVVAALLEAVYLFLITIFFAVTDSFFEQPQKGFLLGAAIMCLFVISAAVSALLFFGYPLYYFIQKQYKLALNYWAGAILTLVVVAMFIIISAVYYL